MDELRFARVASWVLIAVALLAFWYLVYSLVSRFVAGA